MNKNNSPFSQFSRVPGRYNSLGTFIMMSGGQESLTGNGAISLNCYNTKVYTTDANVTLELNGGLQDGQLKKVSFIFSGNPQTSVTINCPSLISIDSQVIMANVGDTVLFMWNGGSWVVLETINTVDPTLQSPVVQ